MLIAIMPNQIKIILKNIDMLLNIYGESNSHIRKALSGNDDDLWAFLLSNELWGGAGSIADQAILTFDAERKMLESYLIELGEAQIKIGRANQRTNMWVSAFKKWQ